MVGASGQASRPPGTVVPGMQHGLDCPLTPRTVWQWLVLATNCRCIYGALLMLRLQTFFFFFYIFCFAFSDFIPTVWTKMHSNKHQSNSLSSCGFLWVRVRGACRSRGKRVTEPLLGRWPGLLWRLWTSVMEGLLPSKVSSRDPLSLFWLG